MAIRPRPRDAYVAMTDSDLARHEVGKVRAYWPAQPSANLNQLRPMRPVMWRKYSRMAWGLRKAR